MAWDNYSFPDISTVFSSTLVGEFTVEQSGVVEISIEPADDVGVQSRGADGFVLNSKILAPNGTVTITVKQVSPIHDYLSKWYKATMAAGTQDFDNMTVVLRDPHKQKTVTAEGVIPQARTTYNFQAEGQDWSWTLLASNVSED